MKRVLVLTLYSGEQEYEDCVLSVKEQSCVKVEHRVFSGLNKFDGHVALYTEIMKESKNFDVFLKLDADMVLNRPSALKEVSQVFESSPDLDHLVCHVNDHYTGKPIFGVHAFSNRVIWEPKSHDVLFTDRGPNIIGLQLISPKYLDVFVEHAPNPSSFEAFHFGYHRALKAYQPGRKSKNYERMVDQAITLLNLEVNYQKTQRRSLGLAVIASGLVARGELGSDSVDKKDETVLSYFSQLDKMSDADIHRYVSKGSYERFFRLGRIVAVGKIIRRLRLIKNRINPSLRFIR